MKQLNIILLLVILLCVQMKAQQKFTYGYDESGNRIKRELVSTMLLMAAKDSMPEQEEEVSLTEQTASPFGLQPFTSQELEAKVDAFAVHIYPNPSNGVYTLELPELQDGEQGMLQVYSTLGQLVREQRAVRKVQSVNITGTMPGYYLVKVTVEGKVVVKTLIKQ